MARLAIFTSGTLGDHLPYLALAQDLRARGHDVLMVINRAMHPYAARAELTAVSLTDIERGPEEARENAWAWDHWRNPLHLAHEHPKAEAQPPERFIRQVHELAEFARGADLLLATAIRPHGLAAHLISGVPWLTLSVNPSAFALPDLSAAWEQAAGAERSYYDRIRPLLDRAVREAGGRRLTPAWYYGCLWAPHVLLGSSSAFSRPDADLLQPFASLDQTGFWYWDDPAWADWRPAPELAAFCERSPLVLAFSSQPLEDPRAVLTRFARAAARLEMPLLVQHGWAGFKREHLPRDIVADQVFFLDYAPHDWLFARAAAAIQHGGIGSLARALRQFCPVVIAPFGNDQFYNAQRVAELGVGASLHPFEAAEEDIVAAVRYARSRPVRLRARLLGRKLREEQGAAAAVDLIERALEGESGPVDVGGAWKRPSLGLPRLVRRGAAREAAGAQPIPRIIHHTWKDRAIPVHFQSWYESWRAFHPDWEFRLWTDEACRSLVAEKYPWFLPVYDAYTDPINRVDAARYFILHQHGGLYVDLDYEALRPLDALLEGRRLVLTTEPPAHLQRHMAKLFLGQMICNAIMASAPAHPFWEHVFELLAAWQAAPGPLDATGPFLLSRAYAGFAEREEITIEPYQRLCPISSADYWPGLPEETRALIGRDAYAIHHWFGSWWMEPVVSDRPAAVQIMEGGTPRQESRQATRGDLLAHGAGMARRPLVSCLMVTRDRPTQAQLAVRLFQQQSYADRELVIVDDGPVDGLETWLEENPDPRIRYMRLPDEGRPLGDLRSLALDQARGEYVAQWDDDDLSAPLRLELQMAALSMYDARACLLARQLIWMPGAGSLVKSTYRLWEGSAVLPREALRDYPALRRGEDTPVVERVAARERVVLLDMPELYVYTFHGRNTFEVDHWLAHVRQATVRYEGFRYAPALDALEGWLGVNLRRLGAFLSNPPFAQARRDEEPAQVEAVQIAPRVEQPPLFTGPDEDTLHAVLILTPVKDAALYLDSYLANLRGLDYPRDLLSLAFLESDSRDDTARMIEEALPGLREEFGRVEFYRRDYGLKLETARWETPVQRERRGVLARSRNALLQKGLRDERWVLWIDVDVAEWPADVLRRLLAAGKRIVVPNCLRAQGDESFDLNSFQLAPGAEDLDWSPYLIDGLIQPPKGFGRRYLSDLRDQVAVALDGVGGTMLLVDAELHRDGLIFPPVSYKGFIDTEGLAVMARDMGVRCWGLPDLIIRHS